MEAHLAQLASSLSNHAEIIREIPPDSDYLTDATPNIGSALAVVLANDENDVVTTVKFCRENRIAVVPRGAGTGLSGGAIPSGQAIVLSTERMKRIKIDSSKRIARCGPGCITKQIMNEAAKHDLTYLPDPASYEESTIGGNVAENAGGLRCKRFGVTRDYVLGLRVVLADGSLLKTGSYSELPSFNLTDLIVGSEGTLGIVTEICLELAPIPVKGSTILASFPNVVTAGNTVADIVRSGIVPTVMEFMDGDAAACSNQYEKNEGLEDSGALLLLESDGARDPQQTDRLKSICQQNGALLIRLETDDAKVDELWRVRRNLSKAAKAAAELRLSEDVAVPVSRFAELVDWVANENQCSPLRINSFGHAGDGNLHVNYLAREDSDSERQLIHKHVERLIKKTIKLGGTISGEHGIGLEKREFLPLEYDRSTLDIMQTLKSEFDPDQLLNPGKIFG